MRANLPSLRFVRREIADLIFKDPAQATPARWPSHCARKTPWARRTSLAAPVVNRAELVMLAVGFHFSREGDEQVAVVRPIHAQPAVVLLSPLQKVGRNMEVRPHDPFPIGTAFEICPREITE